MEEYERERGRRKRLTILRRRRIRDFSDPFDSTTETFTKKYRLDQDLARFLIALIRPHVRPRYSHLAVPLERKVLGALRFFASGTYQAPVGDLADLSVAQPTVCNVIQEITLALNHAEVVTRFVKFPRTRQEAQHVIDRNRQRGGKVPQVVGYIDGSLIEISKPSIDNGRLAYIGRKGNACLNVQFVCDRDLYIMNVNSRFPGSTHDSYIYQLSAVRERMIHLHNAETCYHLGDSGYPQEPWLLTPFARGERPEVEDTPEGRFNVVHCSDRNVVERAIGRLKMVWRAICNERRLHYSPEKAGMFVVACTVLHNMCILGHVDHNHILPANQEQGNHFVNPNEGWVEPPHQEILERGRAARQHVVELLEEGRHNML